METWSKFFGKVNEHHKEGKKEQIKFICDVLDKMPEKDVEKVYKYIESTDFYKNEYEEK